MMGKFNVEPEYIESPYYWGIEIIIWYSKGLMLYEPVA
jgi:hypothetical protein